MILFTALPRALRLQELTRKIETNFFWVRITWKSRTMKINFRWFKPEFFKKRKILSVFFFWAIDAISDLY
jgi:hypothetical protein